MDRLEEAMQTAVQYQDGLQVRLAASAGGEGSDEAMLTNSRIALPRSCRCDAVNSPASIHAVSFQRDF